ncbi:hypothetical protein Patl1_19215 [Pistacia atlantica]|uniref:Uncharacterized protein n=1 Tax=Pistacia atlantica TaxID=434234 RepID=A0ACC1BYK2_9ROSI|nr:hypothetical protein Patl1_19215 [Pistacia atlantica]
MFGEEMSLNNWVENSLPRAVTEVVDANLLQEEQGFGAKIECLPSIIELAMDCLKESLEQRITMKDAVVKIKNIKEKYLNDVGTT